LWRALLSRHVTSPDRLAEPDVGGDAGSALWRAWAVKMLPEVAPSGTLTIQFRPRGPISRSVLAAIPDQREQQRCASQKSRYLCAQNSTINSRKPSMNRTDPCGSLVLPTLTPGLAHGAGSSRNTGPGTRVPHQPTSRAEAESTPNQLPMPSPSAPGAAMPSTWPSWPRLCPLRPSAATMRTPCGQRMQHGVIAPSGRQNCFKR
jgi:hypothetical protein